MMAPTAPLRAFCVVCINRLRTRREEWPAAGPPAFEKKGWGRCISVTSSRSVLILYLFPFPFLFFAMSILEFIFFLSYSSVSSAFPSLPVPSLTSLSSRVPSLPPLCPRSVFRTSHGRSGSPIDRRGNLPCGRTPPRLHSPRSTSGLKLTWSLPPSRPPSLTPSSPHTLLPSRFPSLAPAFPHVLPSRPSSLTPSSSHSRLPSRPPSPTVRERASCTAPRPPFWPDTWMPLPHALVCLLPGALVLVLIRQLCICLLTRKEKNCGGLFSSFSLFSLYFFLAGKREYVCCIFIPVFFKDYSMSVRVDNIKTYFHLANNCPVPRLHHICIAPEHKGFWLFNLHFLRLLLELISWEKITLI